ncbi:alkaline phosphatase [Lottiidibacillus patelloidae]|uniref:Alkaline phosphatase n=1 Tax=Lottiidibacillus patelloidae TaxID=2670334 RepID=A0A263BRW3_9BACI|nr:DeoR family transcriptional regulator [Lottiidibacillus patelloidae]OZM56107.1 alkaline phosphatase [Lottiidibacillus patelloidae]
MKPSSNRMMTRIKAMYFYIHRKGTVTTKELVEEFGTTQRTVQRDLHILSYNGLVESPARGTWTTTTKKVKKTS